MAFVRMLRELAWDFALLGPLAVVAGAIYYVVVNTFK